MQHGSLIASSLIALALAGCGARQARPPPDPGTVDFEPKKSAEEPAPGRAPVANDDRGCPADAPEPAPEPPVPGPRPFIEVLPGEDVPLTSSKSNHEVKFGKAVCEAKQEVWRDAQGRIRVCTVARRVTVMGIDIARDAYTHFHEDGRPFQTHLARQQELTTAKGDRVSCAPGLVVLSKSGTLEHCKLARTMTLGGVPCRGGEDVHFHHDGELAAAVVDRATTVAGAPLPAGTRLYWFANGKVEGGWLPEPARLDGTLVRWEFALHENGHLRSFELAEKKTFQGEEFPARAKLELRADGSLKTAEYEVDHGFMPHGELWRDTKYVSFDCRGKAVSEHTEHWQASRPPPIFGR